MDANEGVSLAFIPRARCSLLEVVAKDLMCVCVCLRTCGAVVRLFS